MKEKLLDYELEFVDGGLTINGVYYDVDRDEDKLKDEFEKSHQKRKIDATYLEYKKLVDKGVIVKDPVAYEYACKKLRGEV